jgi:malate dehydrogenase (oxaloacetate-decarboxylating)
LESDIDLAYLKSSTKLCRVLAQEPDESVKLTNRWNRVAIITDGSGIPGMGDIGPLPALPYVESKALIYKKLADIEAFPLVLASQNIDEIVRTVTILAPSVGAINLEGISESRCLEIKNRLMEQNDLPVFQDNMDAIPIVCLAALLNALKLVKKSIGEVSIVISGSDAEATPIVEFLAEAGAVDIIVCDRAGAIHRGRPGYTNWVMEELAQKTNPRQVKGDHAQALIGADVYLSLSGPPVLNAELISTMNPHAILFYLSDCTPELFSRRDFHDKPTVVATTCPALPNQLTNCLVFPGLLRGAIDAMAKIINMPMKMAATLSLANMISADNLDYELIIPQVLRPDLVPTMAKAVSDAAKATGVSQLRA